jgi:hypothetical protein
LIGFGIRFGISVNAVDYRQFITVAGTDQNPAFQRAAQFVAAFFQGCAFTPAAAAGRNVRKKTAILRKFVMRMAHGTLNVFGKHKQTVRPKIYHGRNWNTRQKKLYLTQLLQDEVFRSIFPCNPCNPVFRGQKILFLPQITGFADGVKADVLEISRGTRQIRSLIMVTRSALMI